MWELLLTDSVRGRGGGKGPGRGLFLRSLADNCKASGAELGGSVALPLSYSS